MCDTEHFFDFFDPLFLGEALTNQNPKTLLTIYHDIDIIHYLFVLLIATHNYKVFFFKKKRRGYIF